VEKKTKVKPIAALGTENLQLASICMKRNRLLRHGGLIREQSDTIRIRRGRLRHPPCSQQVLACSPVAEHTLPHWQHSLEAYLELVGTHGLPEEDRPKRCPAGCSCQRMPHRHSHYERCVFTLSRSGRIYIFRFRCPGCGYVHSVIPAFLEPYQRLALDLQEELVDAVYQGATLEAVAEASDRLPSGPIHEKTMARLLHGWNERLAQLESGLWAWLLHRAPHLSPSRCASRWSQLRSAWQAIREQMPVFQDIRFLHGLNRLCFSLAVTVHG